MDTTRPPTLTGPTLAAASSTGDRAITSSAPPPRADATAVVTARGLECRYGDFTAVRSIDLTVHRGELFALLGTNGAGKTTTLETLEGHRRPDAGRVRVLGSDPSANRRRLAARTGIVFQQSGVPGDLTPREFLTLWRQLTPAAAHHHGVDATLTRVELEHRADVRVHRLSGGERRRLDLAVALVNDPEVVFLDEPTTGMDPQARERTWRIIRELLGDGVTVVLTTHYLEEAEALADRLAIMHEGQVATEGTLAEVVATDPASIHAVVPSDAPRPPLVSDSHHLDPAGRLTIRTRRLQHDLTALLCWADEHDVRLAELNATEASLAQVFHRIAGAGHPDDHEERTR